MPSNHLILCHPLFLPPSIFPSIMVFSNELVLCIRWPKYWSFSFSISPYKEYSGLISFRTQWFDLAVQDSQESSPTAQFKSISSSALSFLYSSTPVSLSRKSHRQRSLVCYNPWGHKESDTTDQLTHTHTHTHPYMTTGKTIALIRWTFVGKVMSLLFNMLSRLVITFLRRSTCLLVSRLQPPSAVILEPPK